MTSSNSNSRPLLKSREESTQKQQSLYTSLQTLPFNPILLHFLFSSKLFKTIRVSSQKAGSLASCKNNPSKGGSLQESFHSENFNIKLLRGLRLRELQALRSLCAITAISFLASRAAVCILSRLVSKSSGRIPTCYQARKRWYPTLRASKI